MGSSLRRGAPAAALIAMALLAYCPVMRAGYIWDDDAYVTENHALDDMAGLVRIWTDPKATPQYYPLVFTTFWLEKRCWGLDPLGYHLVNVALHAGNAILLWRVLRRLAVPGAWYAAAFFVVHPVHVESVAWITERKNVLSGLFYLGSLLCWLQYYGLTAGAAGPSHRWRLYAAASTLFLAALLSKTVTCTLPLVVLVLLWWKRGRVRLSDVLGLSPQILLGAGMGLITAWLEKHHVGAQGAEWALSPLGHVLLAGRILVFYAGKLFCPWPLNFCYSRWTVDATLWWQYLFPIAAAGIFLVLWLLRSKIGRGPLAAVALFILTLFPALGFINVYPMRYSFVADHFQYLASAAMIALAAASLFAKGNGEALRRPAAVLVALGVIVLLGATTARRARVFRDAESLWLDTLARNPRSTLAHNNYGILLQHRGDVTGATRHYSMARELSPEYPEAYNNLGTVLAEQGRHDEAFACFSKALAIDSFQADTHFNLGKSLAAASRPAEALVHYRRAVELQPDHAGAASALGDALATVGDDEEAIRWYRVALSVRPGVATYVKLGGVVEKRGRFEEAVRAYQQALRLDGESPLILNNLAWLLATCPPPVRDATAALQLARKASAARGQHDPVALDTLAAALAANGLFADAIQAGERALQLAGAQLPASAVEEIGRHLEAYRAGRAWVLASP